MSHPLKLVTIPAAAAVFLLALSGCTAGGTTSSAGTASDTLKMAFFGDISTPDPDTAYDGQELNLVDSAYQGLVGYEEGSSPAKIVGVLATKWSEKDNTVFTFTLRKGVKFHDGTPFTSAAVKASFDRRTAVGKGPAYMVSDVKKVETPDDQTVVVTLKAPNTAFIPLLASPFGPKMVSPTAIEKHAKKNGEAWFATHDAGTGPYEYGTFDKGTSYQLSRYVDYWGDKPAYKTVDFSVTTSQSTLQLELQSGEIQGVPGEIDKTSLASYEKDDALSTTTWPSMQTPTLFVNPKSSAFGDAATRRSFLSGIDLKKLVSTALGDEAETTSEIFPVGMLDSSVDQTDIDHSDSAFADLAAGALKGKTIKIGYAAVSTAGKNLSDNLAAQLNAAGITAQSVSYGQGAYYSVMYTAKAPDLTIYDGFPDTGTPEAWARVFYTPSGGLDLFGASVDGMDEALDKGKATGEAKYYSTVTDLVNSSGLWYPLATEKGAAVFSSDVSGVDSAYNPIITGLLDYSKLAPKK